MYYNKITKNNNFLFKYPMKILKLSYSSPPMDSYAVQFWRVSIGYLQGSKDNIMSMAYGNRLSRFEGLNDLKMLVIGYYYH